MVEVTPDEQALAALDEVADSLDAAAVDQRRASRRLRRLGQERRRGRPWREVLGGGVARELLGGLTALATGLTVGGARLRRVIARTLRSDGLRVGEIAALLGVSHQRASGIVNGADHTTPEPEVRERR